MSVSLRTGKTEDKFMVYRFDGKTPRVLFKIVNGILTKAEAIDPSEIIPSEHHFCLCPPRRLCTLVIVNGYLAVGAELSAEIEARAYNRAVTAGLSTIGELVKFLEGRLSGTGPKVTLPHCVEIAFQV